MSYCDDCILLDICGKEGCCDEAMIFCADKNKFIYVSILDKIRAEIDGIEINGQVDIHTSFIRTGDHVKQMALDIIDKYTKGESE